MLNVQSVETLQRTTRYSCLLYGEPGVGKTSFALTATNPLLLDCDQNGSARVKIDLLANAACANIQSFQELEAISLEDIEPYDTIILDTFGAIIEYAIKSITLGVPTVQQWGQVRTKVLNFLHKIQPHKNIIAIAHANTVDAGSSSNKVTKYEPLAQGSAIDSFITSCSCVGFMYRNNNAQTVISFSGGETTQGKNTFDFPPQLVIAPNDTMAFQRLEKLMYIYRQQEHEKQQKFKDIWLAFLAKLEQATTPEHFTLIRNEYLAEDDIFNLHNKVRMFLNNKNKLPQFQFQFNQQTQSFYVDKNTDEKQEG